MKMNYDIKGKNVVIIGYPCAGKSYLVDKIESKSHTIIRTDDYIHYGFKASLYKIMEDIDSINGNWIVEGVMGYRLIRKLDELIKPCPNIVIEVVTSEDNLRKEYKNREVDIEKQLSFRKSLDTTIMKYHSNKQYETPTWYVYENNY